VAQYFVQHNALLGQWLFVTFLCFVSVIYDLAARRIPNFLTLPALALGLTYAFVTAGPWGGLESFAAGMLAASPYLILFLFAGGGAGDVKLMAAVGSWLGFPDALVVLAAVSIAAVVFGIIWAAAHGRAGSVFKNLARVGTVVAMFSAGMTTRKEATSMIPENSAMTPMPYAVPIFLGVLASAMGVWLWTH